MCCHEKKIAGRKANKKGKGQNPHPFDEPNPKGCGRQDHIIASRALHAPNPRIGHPNSFQELLSGHPPWFSGLKTSTPLDQSEQFLA